jgi:DNA-binding MarR family transcriptional regulator
MAKKKKRHETVLTLERFLPYRLSVTSNRISELIATHYRTRFGLTVTEWRIMAVLGEYPGVSAEEVCRRTETEKSILSRAVTRLLQRELIERAFSPTDKRRSVLTLSVTGQAIYRELVPLALSYEKQLLSCFSKSERKQLDKLLDRLFEHADTLDWREDAAEEAAAPALTASVA